MQVIQQDHTSVVYPENYDFKVTNSATVDEIVRKATEAARYIYGKSDLRYRVYFVGEMLQDARSLFLNQRYRPLVIGRFICFRELKNMGWKDAQIGNYFGVDRTTVINGLKCFRDIKFSPDLEDAFEYYKGL